MKQLRLTLLVSRRKRPFASFFVSLPFVLFRRFCVDDAFWVPLSICSYVHNVNSEVFIFCLAVQRLLLFWFDFSVEAFHGFFADGFVPLANAFDYLGKIVFEFFFCQVAGTFHTINYFFFFSACRQRNQNVVFAQTVQPQTLLI